MFLLSTVTAEVDEKSERRSFDEFGFRGFCVRKCGFGSSQESALRKIEADIIDYFLVEMEINISKDMSFEYEDINAYSDIAEFELSGDKETGYVFWN